MSDNVYWLLEVAIKPIVKWTEIYMAILWLWDRHEIYQNKELKKLYIGQWPICRIICFRVHLNRHSGIFVYIWLSFIKLATNAFKLFLFSSSILTEAVFHFLNRTLFLIRFCIIANNPYTKFFCLKP